MTLQQLEDTRSSVRFPMPRKRLAWKLGIIVAVMGGMLLLTAVAAAIALQQVLQAEQIRADAQDQARIAYQMRGDVQRYTAVLLDMVWTRTDRTQDLQLALRQFDESMNEARSATLDDSQQQLLTDLAQQKVDYTLVGNEMITASKEGRDGDAAASWINGKEMAERTYDIADRYYRNQIERAEAAKKISEQRGQLAISILIISFVVSLTLGIGITTVLNRQISTTLHRLTNAAQQLVAGKLTLVPITSDDELGMLARAFNTMAADLAAQHEAQVNWNRDLESQVASRTEELQESIEEQQKLLDMIREMSTPIIPVLNGVLVMPLIGILDTERIEQVKQTIMTNIVQFRAHTIILDVTGLPLIDTAVAHQLIKGMQQASLLGTRSIIVGITPEVANTLVQLGIDFGKYRTLIDLRSALLSVLHEHGLSDLTKSRSL